MVDTEITLIRPARRPRDENGVGRTVASQARAIPARMNSVSRGEFFAAGNAGMRAEFRFVVFPEEYEGETLCEWEGKRYAIYRTFRVPGTDDLELYVKREVGVHGA